MSTWADAFDLHLLLNGLRQQQPDRLPIEHQQLRASRRYRRQVLRRARACYAFRYMKVLLLIQGLAQAHGRALGRMVNDLREIRARHEAKRAAEAITPAELN